MVPRGFQSRLAKKLGVSKTTVSKVLRGESVSRRIKVAYLGMLKQWMKKIQKENRHARKGS